MIKIGLEIHVSLNTNSKLFCKCSTKGDVNENVCEVCLGYPGSRLCLNENALVKCLKIAKALNCNLSEELIFSRKSYFYPDLSKNYQVSMLRPLGLDGYVDVDGKNIGITQVHLEEDPASSTRAQGYSLLDYSRSGAPLAEIVTKPDISSAKEAREFMKTLLTILKYIDVFDLDGIIKADVNVSIKKNEYTRVEVKNVTGFKDIQRVIEHEIKRQEKEGAVLETRGWDSIVGKTYSMRKKESSLDYGYIYEPDIPVIKNNFEIELPQMPIEKINKYTSLKITLENAKIISEDPLVANLFDKIILVNDPVFSSLFFRTHLLSVLQDKSLKDTKISSNNLNDLIKLFYEKQINKLGMEVILNELLIKDIDVNAFAKSKGLIQIKDESVLEDYAKEAISENPSAVNDYSLGEGKALNFLVGKVMQKSKGKANPGKVAQLIKKLLD